MRMVRPRGFTLIEILVVISIIIILVGTVLAIGTQMRTAAQIRQTKVTLNTLKLAMKDYLDAGNPEPADNSATDYYTKFLSVPSCKKVLSGMPAAQNGGTQVLDAFGNAIIYRASAAGKQWYFQSAGPNGVMGYVPKSDGTTVPPDNDDIFSYDL
jgi:prepilin-type N-terminal cleavage/methylation domain-containing protein